MERNMRKNFESGLLSTDVMPPSHGLGWKPPRMTSGSISSESGSRLLRTLSTYDDSFLEEPVLDDDREALRYAGAGARRRRRSLSPRSMAWSREISELRAVARERSAKRRGEDEVVDKSIFPLVDKSIFPPHSGAPGEASERTVDDLFLLTQPAFHRARNSTGTMFIDHTLASPDKDATIRCVCHVLRAHMAAADAAPRMRAESDSRAREFAVFEDDDYVEEDDDHLPSAAKLVAFYRDVFSRGQLELECIVTSLIYVERLLRATRGRIKLRASNWRPILFAAMVMASKVCDDLSMWNADFGHICRAFDLQRINALEAALLRAYGFNATVPASEYAKYYFHLRSMAARLGLATGADAGPLDVTTARGIALRSRAHYGGAEDLPAPNLRRAMSLGADPRHEARRKVQATLEQIVDMSPTKVAGVTASPK
ncbi:hypothetical protein M885DRAFT_160135 [Pelagophyceae sp. CCMP2097]|nr:hypothetical protein M885DRAFT_160135 [Pelagophyceae sp. CCMP2097]